MSSRAALAVVLVLALAVVGEARAHEQMSIPSMWRADRSAHHQVRAVQGKRIDREAYGSLQRALLGMDGEAAIADPEFVFPSRAGDLDADGKDDVITFEFAGEASNFSARRGVSGEVLWEVPNGHLAVPIDLTGDGSQDVLVLASERPALAPGVNANDQRLDLRAADGSVIWSHSIEGTIVRISTGKYSGLFTDQEFVASVRVIPDASGDGMPDVFVGTIAFVQLANDAVIVTAESFTGRTLDGGTGAEIGRVTAAAVNGLPWVVPAADLSGDGLSDLVSFGMTSEGASALTARTVEGDVHWEREVDTNVAYVFVHEMTGDGKPDVMLQAFIDGNSIRLGFDGTDGTTMWTRPDAGYIDAAGDVDGDGGIDFIQLESLGSDLLATAWSGAGGSVIWGPHTQAGPDGSSMLFCFCTDDVTGDGVWDPLSAAIEFGEPVSVTVGMLDGADGSPLWTTALSGSDGFPIPLGADLDGDGAADLGLAPSGSGTFSVRAVRGLDFTTLWYSSGPIEGSALGFYGDDVAGDPAAELLVASVRLVGESFAGEAHAVAPGGRLWTVP